jgi:FtsP/CotA-like multicopper oxidase with cupredoxin domain
LIEDEVVDMFPFRKVFRPCYQANTLSGTPDHTVSVDLIGGGSKINGLKFGDQPFLDTLKVGTLVEMTVKGMKVHPFHLHTFPFQINSLDSYGEYYQKGDWHGTVVFLRCDQLNPSSPAFVLIPQTLFFLPQQRP